MKVRPSVKKICEKCKIIKRKGKIMVICETRSISSARAEPAPPAIQGGAAPGSRIPAKARPPIGKGAQGKPPGPRMPPEWACLPGTEEQEPRGCRFRCSRESCRAGMPPDGRLGGSRILSIRFYRTERHPPKRRQQGGPLPNGR